MDCPFLIAHSLLYHLPFIYHKRDDLTFLILTLPFTSSNIPAVPGYGVYIAQFIRYSRACGQYSDFLGRVQLITQRLLKQGYAAPGLLFRGCPRPPAIE